MWRALLFVCVFYSLPILAEAQRGQGQGGPQTPPVPAPTPAPAPAQPRTAVVTGRIITGSSGSLEGMQVRLEGQGFELIDLVYTNSNGGFQFRQMPLNQSTYYVVVNEEGFEPVRERMDQIQLLGGVITLFLQPETRFVRVERPAPDGDNPNVVSLRQLQAEIPREAVEEYERAGQDAERGDHERAIERLERAVSLAPDFYEAYINLGGHYLRGSRYRDAETAFGHAREVNPTGVLPLLNLGILYYQEGEGFSQSAENAGNEDAAGFFVRSRDVLEEAHRLYPASGPVQFYLGASLYKLGSYDSAEQLLLGALNLDSSLQDSRLMLVNVYARQNRLDEALAQVQMFLAENPDSPRREAIERIQSQIETLLAQ